MLIFHLCIYKLNREGRVRLIDWAFFYDAILS